MLRECITDEEYSAMDNYRDDYAYMGISHRHREVPIKDILSCWETNKIDLFNLFGKQLKITKSINYTRSLEETVKEMYKINSRYSTVTFGRENRNGSTFVQAYQDWIDETFSNYWKTQEGQVRHYGLLSLVNNANNLARNYYVGETFSIELPNGKNYTVSTGCKVLRALGKIASAFNIPGFEDFRICHSLILNDKTLNGELTLSIHPLDYWTMSDNNCGWSSCMSWEEFGAFRQGTVEMMNSRYVVVAYLSATDSIEIGCDDLPWSNKKWRQLFIVDKNFIMGIKSYPYENDYLTQEILHWIAELAKENMGWTYDDDLCYYHDYHIFNLNNETLFCPVSFHTYRMYNDIGACKKHWTLINRAALEECSDFRFTFSGETQCMCCGAIDTDESEFSGNESTLCCMDCDELRYCSCCESIITECDDYYELDGEYYCYGCYTEHFSICDNCKADILNEDTKCLTVVLCKDGSELTVADHTLTLCSDCFEELSKTVPIYNKQYVYIQDLQIFYNNLLPYDLRHLVDLDNLPEYYYYKTTVADWKRTDEVNNPN